MSADKRWEEAFARGAARAAQRERPRHEAMRKSVRAKTDDAVDCLKELRVQHAGDGSFANGVFMPAGVSRQDVALAFKRPSSVPPKEPRR